VDAYAWPLNPEALVILPGLAGGYWLAVRRLGGAPRWRVACFAAGILLLLVVSVTPVHLLALPLWLANYFVWHLPPVYDAALRHPHSLLHLEHALYVATGVLMFWPLFQDVPHRLATGTRVAYVFAAFVFASPLGLVLALVPEPVYGFYEAAPRTWGLDPLEDQQLAGVTMALEEAAVFFAIFARMFLRFLAEQDEDAPAAAS
jgi:cytochrome c oxidase assembly factor CtaG